MKQKAAYEMRISYWSSDVCASDLLARQLASVRDDWETFSIVVHLGMGDRHGAEAIAWTLRQAAAADHSVALDLPDPTGRRLAVPIAFVDQTALAAELAVPEVRSRSEEHTSELQSLMRISYAVFC